MRYPGGNPSTLFCEQVSTVTSLFEKWSDCERTVVMYALLKRLRYPSLKFLQYSIESNLTQSFDSQNLALNDVNANNPSYLEQLVNTYKGGDNDSIFYGSDLHKDIEKNYRKKEEILNDVLDMLPLLKPGNEEAKAIYLSLIPLAVEDTGKQIVDTELVQQIFSYLLIHPAITNEDRRSLSLWLRNLEENIHSSFAPVGQMNFYVLSNSTDSCKKSESVSSLSNDSSRSWQTIAPPTQIITKHQQQQQVPQTAAACTILQQVKNEWSSNLFQIPDNLCEDIQRVNMADVHPIHNSLGLIYDNPVVNADPSNSSSVDDHHVSFSKNGTEIIDFEMNDCDKCSEPLNYNFFYSNVGDAVNISRWNIDSKTASIKTRRSNSLTTAAISTSSSSASSVITANENCSNSSENLAQYAQKPRSFSLSIENQRAMLTSCGSDTRLDDLKPNYLKFTTHNIGMSNIGQWLKSLRLHKYIGLFTNITYEEMLTISEDYLQSLNVTKGASHKLAICIEKLKERCNRLTKLEQDLISNSTTISAATDELTNIVLTPMKPADSNPNNVASKFLQVLDLVCHTLAKKDTISQQDEDCVSALLWILERSIHNEAFVAHTNQLKEHKFKLSKIKMQFAPKNHHIKSGSNSNLNKSRWNSKCRKTDKCGSNDRIHRKNSNDTIIYSIGTLQPQQQQTTTNSNISSSQCSSHDNDIIYHSTKSSQPSQYNNNSCQQYKSSSYPNFSNAGKTGPQQLQQVQQHQQQLQQQQQPQYRHHRHSLNNLIVISSNPQQSQHVTFTLQKQQQQQQQQQSSKNGNNTSGSSNIVDGKHRLSLTKSSVPMSTTVSSIQNLPTQTVVVAEEISGIEMTSPVENSVAATSSSTVSTVSSTNSNLTSISSVAPLNRDKSSKNTIGDINSSLEFLCLQMTEQAIN